jgi:hypothetical protein
MQNGIYRAWIQIENQQILQLNGQSFGTNQNHRQQFGYKLCEMRSPES